MFSETRESIPTSLTMGYNKYNRYCNYSRLSGGLPPRPGLCLAAFQCIHHRARCIGARERLQVPSRHCRKPSRRHEHLLLPFCHRRLPLLSSEVVLDGLHQHKTKIKSIAQREICARTSERAHQVRSVADQRDAWGVRPTVLDREMEEGAVVDSLFVSLLDEVAHPRGPVMVEFEEDFLRCPLVGRQRPVERVVVPCIHTDASVAVRLNTKHLAVLPGETTSTTDAFANVAVLGEGGHCGCERDLSPSHAVVERCGWGKEGTDTRVGAIRADDEVCRNNEPVGKCEFVVTVGEGADGIEGMAPLNVAFGDSIEEELAKDMAIDLGACVLKVSVVGRCASLVNERDPILSADPKFLSITA
ncbi:hypothetical protein C8Q79DRAFT_333926 [Trametes meyenii]|nr:hypothetical protein C8Q79DRAFT_333926 [Trametes meyenii]